MRKLLGMQAAVMAGMLAAGTAGAQINYTTTGFFSGPGTTAAGVTCTTIASATASCMGGGFTLVFQTGTGVNLANGTITQLGTFNLTGAGNVTVPAGAIFFTLLVNQTTPSGGQGTFLGAMTGTVSTGATNFSSLIWTPNQGATIGNTTYGLIFDNVGPAAGVGLGIPINNSRAITALVTTSTVPEPATIGLVMTGLAGLIPVAVRRRKKA